LTHGFNNALAKAQRAPTPQHGVAEDSAWKTSSSFREDPLSKPV